MADTHRTAERGAEPYNSPQFPQASDFYRALATARSSGRSTGAVVLRDPRAALRAARFVLRLPEVEVDLSSRPEGVGIRKLLQRRQSVIPVGRRARAVLCLPATEDDYLRGKHRQAVRTNVRRAREMGVSCRSVVEVAERVRLARAVIGDRSTDEEATVQWLEGMLRSGRFYVATAADDTPLVFASVGVDVRCSYLRAFMASQIEPAAPASRYLLHVHLVAELAEAGLAHLITDSGLRPSPGVQYFQHLLGFTVANLRIRHLDT